MYVQKLKTYIHYNNSFNALTAPRYSRIGQHCANGKTETLELNTPKNSLFPFNRNALERTWEQIVIRTEMCMTKIHTQLNG